MGLRALIFDFNGVLVDDEPLHASLIRRVLAEEGIHLSVKEYYAKYLPLPDRDLFKRVLQDHGVACDDSRIADLAARKANYYREHSDSVILFPGARDLVQQAAARYPLAIASGARREEIERALARVSLLGFFQAVVGAEDVVCGKPDPEAFLLALRRINETLGSEISPRECLVLEDSRAGIEAAHRAGMKGLAVATSYPAGELGHADWVVQGLDCITLEQIVKAWDA